MFAQSSDTSGDELYPGVRFSSSGLSYGGIGFAGLFLYHSFPTPYQKSLLLLLLHEFCEMNGLSCDLDAAETHFTFASFASAFPGVTGGEWGQSGSRRTGHGLGGNLCNVRYPVDRVGHPMVDTGLASGGT